MEYLWSLMMTLEPKLQMKTLFLLLSHAYFFCVIGQKASRLRLLED